MFRRVEFPGKKASVMGDCNDAMAGLRCPRAKAASHRRGKFYFTERGWAKWGRKVVDAAVATGVAYRVVAVKEASVDVRYADKDQVMGLKKY